MLNKKVYGYIRVSTQKQGSGVSLIEQKESIIRYAEKHQLEIIQWFEELETAAKHGRPIFTNLMKLLQSGKASGVIIHKIDRSARNLRDWASLGDLIDGGVDVHFAHESVDMHARGGRLSADIQAVIASDYVRNLREETLKGLYGRLKQGIYPFGAPIGYVNKGGGVLKIIDKIKGPLIKKAFELYLNHRYSLNTLADEMTKLGLKNNKGGKITATSLSKILNNPFYTGIMKIKGKVFQGNHEPLISPKQFENVQNILNGKTNTKVAKHNFLFRRLIRCENCKYSLIAEKQKGNVYYRCQTKVCPTKTIREEVIESSLLNSLSKFDLNTNEDFELKKLLEEYKVNWTHAKTGLIENMRMEQGKANARLDKLTDAYLDSVIDKETFESRKESIIIELQDIKLKLKNLNMDKEVLFNEVQDFLELAKSLKNSYLNGLIEEKQKILKSVTSNLSIYQNNLIITMKSPYQEISNRKELSTCGHERGTPRTSSTEIANLANIDSNISGNSKIRESMKALLDYILKYLELKDNTMEELIQ